MAAEFTEDAMEGVQLFAWSVVGYSTLPLVYALRRTRVQFLLLYVHMGALLTFGSIFTGLYQIALTDTLRLEVGQLTYPAFMFTAVITVVIGRDLQVVRNIVLLSMGIAVVDLGLFTMARLALNAPGTLNPYGIDAAIFDNSIWWAPLFVVVVVGELLLLMVMLETSKRHLPASLMPAVYPVAFLVVMAAHGLLTSLLDHHPGVSPDRAVVDNVLVGQLVVTLAYLIPLLLFVGLYRRVVADFESRPLHLRHLAALSRDPLLEQLEIQTYELAEERSRVLASTESVGRVTATVDRILDSSTNTILIALDPDLRITHFNAGAHKLLGWSTHEVCGQGLGILVSPDEIIRHAHALGTDPVLDEVIKVQIAVDARRDWIFVAKDGSQPTISLSVTEVVVDGQVVGHVAAGEDVTSRLIVETAMMTALSREHDALVRLQEADRVKHELVSTVSHELRTPIASITGYTELLHDGAYGQLSPEQVKALDRVLRNTARLEALVDDLLVLERVEAAPLPLEIAPLDLSEVVRGTQEIVAEMVRGRDLKFSVSLPASPVHVNGDRAALESAVINLISNAVKFTLGHGTIALRVVADGDNAWLTISDTGIGIAEADQAQLFARFFRTTQANALAIPGSGLGLSIVQAVVCGHGGEISVTSAPGEGSTFTVSLPLRVTIPSVASQPA